jgi:hypothetical protein
MANKTDTKQVLAEIDSLLKTFQQTGGKGVLADINALMSNYRGEYTELSDEEAMHLAQSGGVRKGKKKTTSNGKKMAVSKGKKSAKKAKSKGKKSKSKGKKSKGKKSKSKSKGKKSKKSKSKGNKKMSRSKGKGKKKKKTSSKSTKSKGGKKVTKTVKSSKPKSKKRSMKRDEGVKPKKKNMFIVKLQELIRKVRSKIPESDITPMNVGAMSSAASKLLNAHDRDVDTAMSKFDKAKFLADYRASKKSIEEKRAVKKASKAAAKN